MNAAITWIFQAIMLTFTSQHHRRGGVVYATRHSNGEWTAVNEFAVAVTIRGGADLEPLLEHLAWAESASECVLWLQQMDLRRYRAFSCLAQEPTEGDILATWNGAALELVAAA